jgi:triacylglycerol esterase/lipase EstA (alpha/beta hydrolase family)
MIIGDIPDNNGFRLTIEYFLSQGYTKAELYGSMWGFADVPHQKQHYHQRENVMYIRTFIDAVLEYTGAPQIDMIAHSMGVTYARRVLKGGTVKAYDRRTRGTDHDLYYIGEPLNDKVNTFIGIAGSNWGNKHCTEEPYKYIWARCNKLSGIWPGSQEE